MVTYGQSIVWTSFGGDRSCINVDGCLTPEEARRDAINSAKRLGWTPPRWWQWWRWDDTRISEDEE